MLIKTNAMILITGLVLGAGAVLLSSAELQAKTKEELNNELLSASAMGHLAKAKKAVGAGADVNAKDNDGKTALSAAVTNKLLDIIKFLVEHGANVNAKDNDGETALHSAALNGNGSLDVVKFLVEHGADVSEKDNKEKIALDVASKKEIVEYLQEVMKRRAPQIISSWLDRLQDLKKKQMKPEERVSTFIKLIKEKKIESILPLMELSKVMQLLTTVAEDTLDAKKKGLFGEGEDGEKYYKTVIDVIRDELASPFKNADPKHMLDMINIQQIVQKLAHIQGLETAAIEIKHHLISTFYETFVKLVNDAQNAEARKDALGVYNLLRVLSGEKEIKDINDIRFNWLDNLEDEFDRAMVSGKLTKLDPQQMLNDAQRALKSFKSIQAGESSYDATGFSYKLEDKKYEIMIGAAIPHLEDRLMVMYHELGHIVHGDTEQGELVYSERINNPAQVLASGNFKIDLNEIDQLTELGKKAFDESTDLGKLVNAILKKYQSFWQPPVDLQERERLSIEMGRAQEKRADLFALESALKQKRLSPIISWLYYWKPPSVDDKSDIVATIDAHPSHFERLLYCAGFLVKNGFDLNGLLREWEQKGVCISTDQVLMKGRKLPSSLPSEEYFWKFRTAPIPSKD